MAECKIGFYMDLQELVATVENMTDACQKVLWEALKEILFRQKGPAKIKHSADMDIIVDFGILCFSEGRYSVAETAKKKIRKLYTYLVRKFDINLYFDPEHGDMREIPKGAEFVCTISMDGSSTLKLQFPDDDVTELLNLFGTNRCEDWI